MKRIVLWRLVDGNLVRRLGQQFAGVQKLLEAGHQRRQNQLRNPAIEGMSQDERWQR